MEVLILKLNGLKCIDDETLLAVISELENYLGVKFRLINREIILPKEFLNEFRMQYDAEKILTYIKRFSEKNSKIVSILCEDIYVEGTNFVFGLAEINGCCCVLSLRRLMSYNKELLRERIFKEMLHELGHCFGLRHCSNNCAMRFSNSLFEVDIKNKYLCERCYSYIKLKLENSRKRI